jgi:hypothetical protein
MDKQRATKVIKSKKDIAIDWKMFEQGKILKREKQCVQR